MIMCVGMRERWRNGRGYIQIHLFSYRDGYLFWTDVAKKSINRAYLNGSSRTTLVKSSVRSPGKMQCAVEDFHNVLVMYVATTKVNCCSSHVAYSITEGLAWDWVTKKVYWTDSGRRKISVYDPERNIRKVVINTGSNSAPKDIALDPMTG